MSVESTVTSVGAPPGGVPIVLGPASEARLRCAGPGGGELRPPQPPAAAETTLDGHGRQGLRSRSFLGLLATQFLVALNDNMFRWLVVPIGKDLVPPNRAAFAVSAGLACFVLPYLLLAAPAGYVADRFSKRNVIIACKAAEIGIMALGVVTILVGNIYLMLAVVALMGAQSAMFGPSKLGSIPEIVRSGRIAAANGLVGMTTVLAIVVGTVAGNFLYAFTTLKSPSGELIGMPGHYHWWISAAALIGVAVVGLFVSLPIGRLRPANPTRTFPLNPVAQTARDQRALWSDRPLLWTALGIVFFWSLGALAQMNVDLFGTKVLLLEQQYVGPLLAVLALGVGAGSVLAGIWSGGKIELGMVPFGAAGIALSVMLLSGVPAAVGAPTSTAYFHSCLWLLTLGLSAGLFDVPLQAFLQENSPAKSRGSILAASNFLTFSGMLGAAGVFWLLGDKLALSGRQIFLFCGLLTVPVALGIARYRPLATLRFATWLLSRLLYRVRIRGLENIPARGGALLVSNHVSWADGLLLGLSCPRHLRMIVYAPHWETPWLGWLGRLTRVIPIHPGRKSIVQSIRTARGALKDGEPVGIFPEGGVTRTGELGQFQPGFLAIRNGADVPVIPVHIGGMWGSIFSYYGGRLFWKLPRRWPYPMSIRFGKPIRGKVSVDEVRRIVAQLGEEP